MTLVKIFYETSKLVWHDNELGNLKVWKREGYNHEFIIKPNSGGVNIVKCKKCDQARMWISLMELKKCQ